MRYYRERTRTRDKRSTEIDEVAAIYTPLPVVKRGFRD
jgi:hypothetical protein